MKSLVSLLRGVSYLCQSRSLYHQLGQPDFNIPVKRGGTSEGTQAFCKYRISQALDWTNRVLVWFINNGFCAPHDSHLVFEGILDTNGAAERCIRAPLFNCIAAGWIRG